MIRDNNETLTITTVMFVLTALLWLLYLTSLVVNTKEVEVKPVQLVDMPSNILGGY